MTFNPQDHVIVMERKAKKKDAQGRDTWEVTKTEYLPVQWRLFWFRLENPKGKIDSHALTLDLEKGAAIFETYVEREDSGSARMHGSETQGDWKDYIEKAQTKSLGRALAAVGYGSQFTDDEFTEGERIVDSPVDRAPEPANGKASAYPGTEHLTNGDGSPAFPAMPQAPTLKDISELFSKFYKPERWETFKQMVLGQQVTDQALHESEDDRVKLWDKLVSIKRAAKGNEQPAA
jgi:hypothetical protein